MVAVFDQVELAAAPKVNLGGQEWTIPLLAPRQNRHVIPLSLALSGVKFESITKEQVDDFYSICYVALTRAHPDLTRDDFDDMPISVMECMRAFPVIARQAGMVTSGNGVPAGTPNPPPASTGTKSSSRSRAPKA